MSARRKSVFTVIQNGISIVTRNTISIFNQVTNFNIKPFLKFLVGKDSTCQILFKLSINHVKSLSRQLHCQIIVGSSEKLADT